MKEALRGIHIHHLWQRNFDFHKWILNIAVEQLFVVSIHDFSLGFFHSQFFLVCNVISSDMNNQVAHPQACLMNHLIHNLHIYLRGDIRKADMGQFVDFVVI